MSFSAVLDSAEYGETIVVTRAGRRVALITPVPRANGTSLREVFARWQHKPALNDAFATKVHAARGEASAELDKRSVARLIFDTGVVIAGARGRVDMAALADTDDVSIPAIAVAEYVSGTLLDVDPGRAAAQRAFLDEVLQVFPVHDYDRSVAEQHAACWPTFSAQGVSAAPTTSSSRLPPAPPIASWSPPTNKPASVDCPKSPHTSSAGDTRMKRSRVCTTRLEDLTHDRRCNGWPPLTENFSVLGY